MKTKNIFLIAVALMTLGIVIYACKNPGEGVTIHVNTNVLKSPRAVQFVNAVKNAANQPGDFPVTIGGKDADKVVTVHNKTDFKAVEGRVFLALKKGVVATESNPVVFTVAAEIPGFTPATQTFKITNDQPAAVVVRVIEYANPVPGTKAKVQEDNLTAGVNTNPITIETPATPGMEEQATIVIPAGTQFLDAAGTVINAAKLESRVVQFGTESPEALAAFPGGFNVASIIGQDGQVIPEGVAFVTAGFIAMDLYAGGTEVKRFSKPLSVTMDVSESLTNPESGTAVKAGDVVPVWSLDDKTGQWKFESNATIVSDGQGNLSASFSASHLSYWNFDWASRFCGNYLNITFNMPGYDIGNYKVEITAPNGYTYPVNLTLSDKKVVSERVPVGTLKVIVKDLNENIIAETANFDACQGNVEVNFPARTDLDLVNVSMTLQGTCPNKPLNENISAFAVLYEKGKTRAQGVTVYLVNGKLDLQVKNNTEYVVDALYGDKWKSANIRFSKSNFTFPGTISGTAVYNQANNTVTVLAQFSLPDC